MDLALPLMDEHPFTREPWIGWAVLLFLGLALAWQVRAAVKLVQQPREDFEATAKSWNVAGLPSLFLILLLWAIFAMAPVFTEGRNFFFGDLLALLAIFVLPSLAEGGLRINAEERGTLAPVFVGYAGVLFGLLVFFGLKTDGAVWTWSSWLTLTATLPLGVLLSMSLSGGEVVLQGMRGVGLLLLMPLTLFLSYQVAFLVLKNEARWSLQANLHDLLGLFALFALAGILKSSFRRAEQLERTNNVASAGANCAGANGGGGGI